MSTQHRIRCVRHRYWQELISIRSPRSVRMTSVVALSAWNEDGRSTRLTGIARARRVSILERGIAVQQGLRFLRA